MRWQVSIARAPAAAGVEGAHGGLVGHLRHGMPCAGDASDVLAEAARLQEGTHPRWAVPSAAASLRETHGVAIRPEDWDTERLPDHLRVTFAVQDRPGHVVASGKDLAALREQAAPTVRRQVAAAGRAITRTGLRTWDVDEVPREYDAVVGGVRSDECRALMQEFFKQRRGVKADAVAASGSGLQASGDRKEAMGDGR